MHVPNKTWGKETISRLPDLNGRSSRHTAVTDPAGPPGARCCCSERTRTHTLKQRKQTSTLLYSNTTAVVSLYIRAGTCIIYGMRDVNTRVYTYNGSNTTTGMWWYVRGRYPDDFNEIVEFSLRVCV